MRRVLERWAGAGADGAVLAGMDPVGEVQRQLGDLSLVTAHKKCVTLFSLI